MAESVSSQDSRPIILARASDFVNLYSSTAFTVAQASLSDSPKRALITKFMTAMLEANNYLSDVKAMQCSVGAISSQLNVSSPVASLEYAAVIDAVTGEISPL